MPLGPEGRVDCLVLGAGTAGIAAARNLRFPAAGRRPASVLVLEGSDRLGGRILTLRSHFDGPVELGAQYIHRPPGSVPLWEEIERYRLQVQKIQKMRTGKLFHAAWGAPPKSILAGAFSWNVLDGMLLYPRINSHSGPDLSVADWVRRMNYDEVGADFASLGISQHLPGSMDEISVRGFRADRIASQLQGMHEYRVIAGYDEVVRSMADGLDIHYGQRVESIHYGAAGVEVRIRGGKVYRARSAVCTFSVGMLKSGEVEFAPALPKAKLEALDHIGVGPMTKVVMQFEDKFWPSDMYAVHRLDRSRRAGRTYFHEFYGEAGKRATLNTLIAGDDARRVAHLDDSDLLARICQDLDEMFPHAAPTRQRVSRNGRGVAVIYRKPWADDPFAKGGTSYLRVRPSAGIEVEEARAILASAEHTPPLFWAGEATSIDTQPVSVHGAHMSGLRATLQVQHFLEPKEPSRTPSMY